MGGWPWPLDSVQGWFESFWNTVTKGFTDLTSSLSSGLSSAVSTLQNGLGSVISGIQQGLGDLGSQISSGLSGLLMTFEDALGDVGKAITDGLKVIGDAIGTGFRIGVQLLIDFILKPIVDAIQALLDAAVQAIKGLAKTFIDTLIAMAPHSPIGGLEAGVIALGLAAGFEIVAAGAATILDAAHPFHSLEIKQLVFSAMAATGIRGVGPSVVGAIFEIAILKPMVQELNELFVREIPGPSDLVRFVVREQISPDELELWLKRQGFGPKWSTAFWGAHWVIPSREEAAELYHRGIYDLQKVTDLLVLNDRRPDTIQDLLALTFRTPTRQELVQLAEVADVPEASLLTWLRADGISEELLPVYLTLVRSRRIIRILTRVEALVRGEIETGRLQVDEGRAILQEYRFAPDVIDAELALAKRARDLQLRQELVQISVETFRKNLIQKGDLLEELRALGVDGDRAGTILALEEIRKAKKIAPPAPTTPGA